MMPTASDFVSTVTLTRDLGTADLDIDVETKVGGTSRRMSGVGTAGLHAGVGDITWTDVQGTTRELGTFLAIYVQADPPDGPWYRLDDGQPTTRSGFADPLSGLGSLEGVTATRADSAATGAQTVYSGTLPVDPVRLRELGFSDEEIAGLGESWQNERIDVSVRVDGLGRIVRVDRAVDITGDDGLEHSVSVTTRLSDFSGGLDLTAPPSESVVPAPTRSSPPQS